MLVLASIAAAAALARAAAPGVRKLVAALELRRPGMRFLEAARTVTFVDGVWAEDELVEVVSALQGGRETPLLKAGAERVEALIRGGCPHCPTCRYCYPSGLPPVCQRCASPLQEQG